MTVFYLSMVGMFALAFAAGYLAREVVYMMRKPEPQPTSTDSEYAVYSAVTGEMRGVLSKDEATTFAVAGKPKKPPFRERKKDLRAAARTERKKREEWRD